MVTIGSYLTIAKGFANAAKTALEIGGNTFQFFSRNPRGSRIKALDKKDLEKFQIIRQENHFGPILAHAPYTMNLASANDVVYEFGKQVIKEDIKRMDSFGIEYFNLHPGSHIGGGLKQGTKKIIEALNEAIQGDEKITVLLETMSGKGSEIEFRFEQLQTILEGINHPEKVGICMDLCHLFASGYDIINDFEKVIQEFDTIIGIDRLKAIHLNDSMMPFASKKDRHSPLGEGEIGLEAIKKIIKHTQIRTLPFYLETPLENEGHAKEIKMVKQVLEEQELV